MRCLACGEPLGPTDSVCSRCLQPLPTIGTSPGQQNDPGGATRPQGSNHAQDIGATLPSGADPTLDSGRVPTASTDAGRAVLPSHSLIGTTVGEYRITRRIGEGGMGTVYLAVQPLIGKSVAIKVLKPELTEDRSMTERFVDEARAVNTIGHENIVDIFSFGSLEPSGLYFVMEFLKGRSLYRHLQDGPWPSGSDAAHMLPQILRALGAAHAHGIIHRDLKPDNIFLESTDTGFRVKLLDFGIAKFTTEVEGRRRTQSGTPLGTPLYMSPEQCQGTEVGPQADIYSFGAILYELFTGRPPFTERSLYALILAHVSRMPEPPRRWAPVDDDLDRLIMRCLAKDPAERPSSAEELAGLLDPILVRLASSTEALVHDQHPTEKPLVEPTDSVEQRRVVIVRGVLPQYSPGTDQPGSTTGRFLAALAEQLRELANQVDATLDSVDETGFTVVLGLSAAGEEDASRAVGLAFHAMEIYRKQCAEEAESLPIRMSAVRGTAIARRSIDGSIRYDLPADLMVRGMRVALAAGDHHVGVDVNVYRSARALWEFEPIANAAEPTSDGATPPSALLAGEAATGRVVAEQEATYRLLSQRARESTTASRPSSRGFIGRQHEMALVEQFLSEMDTAGRPRLLEITGPKGIGKLSLVREAITRAAVNDLRLVQVSAEPLHFLQHHAVVSSVVLRLMGLTQASDGAAVSTRLQEIAAELFSVPGGAAGRFANALGLLFDLEPDPEAPLSPDPEERDEQLQGALQRLLRWRTADGPILVALIDLHLSRPHSLEHLGPLLAGEISQAVSVIATSTDINALEPLRQPFMTGKTSSIALRLGELTVPERREYAHSRFSKPEESVDLVDHIVARAGGNPFLIDAVLESLVEQGACRFDSLDPDRRMLWSGDRSVLPEIPSSIEDLIIAQIDRLRPTARSVIRHASVFGMTFLQRHLERLLDGAVTEPAKQLIDAGLFAASQDAPGQFAFSYGMVQEVVYHSIPETELAGLHLRAANVLLADRRSVPEQLDAQIAHHLEMAGEEAQAASRYLRAAQRAKRVADSGEALMLYGRALRLLQGQTADQFAVHQGREELFRRKGDRTSQFQEIQRMIDLAGSEDDIGWRATAHGLLVRYYQDGGEESRVVDLFPEAMRYAEEGDDLVLQADLLRLKARALNDLGRNREASSFIQQAFQVCPDTEAGRRKRGDIVHVRGNLHFYTGQIVQAREDFLEAQAIFQHFGLNHLVAAMHMNLGFVEFSLGDYEASLDHYRVFAEISEERGDRYYIGAYLSNAALTHLEMGRWDVAASSGIRAIALCREVDDIGGVSDALNTLGQVRLRQGRLEEALDTLEEALITAKEAEHAYSIARAYVYLTYAYLAAGKDVLEAVAFARQAITIGKDASMPQGRTWGLSAESTALARAGRIEEAISRSNQALALLSVLPERVGVEEVLFNHAQLLLQAEKGEDAALYLELAVGEVKRKAELMKNPENQRIYLSKPPPAEIIEVHHRIVGPTPDLDALLATGPDSNT